MAFSCYKYFELSEDKNFAFWFMDQKQFIMVNKEFPFPKSESFVSVARFKDILKKNKKKYSSFIFTHHD